MDVEKIFLIFLSEQENLATKLVRKSCILIHKDTFSNLFHLVFRYFYHCLNTCQQLQVIRPICNLVLCDLFSFLLQGQVKSFAWLWYMFACSEYMWPKQFKPWMLVGWLFCLKAYDFMCINILVEIRFVNCFFLMQLTCSHCLPAPIR